MNPSAWTSSRPSSRSNTSALRSTRVRTGMPSRSAASTFLRLLSSVPLCRRVGAPDSRWKRASASASTNSRAMPRCGAALTYGMDVVT